MTLAAISNQPIWLPNPIHQIEFVDEVTLDAGGEMHAVIFQAPVTGNITEIGWRVGTINTGNDYEIRIETVDPATGFPTGTLKDVDANAILPINVASDEWLNAPLDDLCAVAQGDVIAAVIKNVDSDFGVSGGSRSAALNFPYPLEETGGGWVVGVRGIIMSVKYDDNKVYSPDLSSPYETVSSTIATDSTDPDEIGLVFQYPTPKRLVGARMFVDLDAETNLKFYTGASLTDTRAIDPNEIRTVGGDFSMYRFGTPHDLAADTLYRITLQPSETANVRLWWAEVNAAAILDAIPGANQNTIWTERVNAGAWDDTNTTRIPWLFGLFDELDNGAGGEASSMLWQAGTSGGANG